MAELKSETEASLLPDPPLPSTTTRARRTSEARLEQSAVDGPALAPDAEPDTVLYLAFGSNLCAETFQGKRGIRPLSEVNVTAPSLRLTFSIPGLPYTEPCFANTAPRKIPEDGIGDPRKPMLPPIEDPVAGEPRWDKGLVGVVYEVTRKDYKRIMATEGGGSSYKEILVPCLAIPPAVGVPEGPGGGVPRPFFARTLCMPFIPSVPGDGHSEGHVEGEGKGWWKWLTRGAQRPAEDYAQPSERYLNLLRTGAAEHELPGDYQRYLAALQSYTIRSTRQKVGKWLMILAWGPGVVLIMALGVLLADKDGKMPAWAAAVSSVLGRAMWWSYDAVFRPLFGDGERTVGGEEGREEGKIRL